MPHGTFYWNELMTRDVERAKKFYSDTIGWSFDGMPMPDGSGTYWAAKIGDQPVAGILDISAPQFGPVPESWMAYIAVDDVDARVKKALAAGARLAFDRQHLDVAGTHPAFHFFGVGPGGEDFGGRRVEAALDREARLGCGLGGHDWSSSRKAARLLRRSDQNFS